jgi:hypothetical protein
LIGAFEGECVFGMPTGEKMMDFVIQLYEHPEATHQRAREKCDKAKQFSRDSFDGP